MCLIPISMSLLRETVDSGVSRLSAQEGMLEEKLKKNRSTCN